MLQHVVFVYLANAAVLCYLLRIICCCQVQNYIYWIISTENDHRHHHKFIKYEKRLRKEANMPRLTYQAKSLPLQRELGRVALPSARSCGPTDPLHISRICSIWKILHLYSSFSLNPSKSAFFHALTLSLLPKNNMLFIVSKQCACSRRVHVEGHMNRVGFNLILVILEIPITIVFSLFCQKKNTIRIFCSITV
jgi:hypothetical protein